MGFRLLISLITNNIRRRWKDSLAPVVHHDIGAKRLAGPVPMN